MYSRSIRGPELWVRALGRGLVVAALSSTPGAAYARGPGPELAGARAPTPLTPDLRARGYNACYMPETGFGSYSHWLGIGMGQMIVPLVGGRTADGGYDVVVHFHGHEAVRRPFVEVARGMVLVGIDLGATSGPYARAFEEPWVFVELLGRITRRLQEASGDGRAHIRHLAISSWSAGFGAVTRILGQFATSVDAVVLLDSLHADYVPRNAGSPRRVFGAPLEGVLLAAERAAHGEAIFYLSHSAIVPWGYASTTEVADYVLQLLGAERMPLAGTSVLGAKLSSGFDREGLHVRGYEGGDKAAHCAHAELLAEAVRDYLEPAWGTPGCE